MVERLEWVQIIEPKSKGTMYANLITGECVWEAPPGAKIKHTDENQWWELFDIGTRRHYYYNAKSQRTVWQRPSNVDVIPLAKLQMIKENTQPKDERTTMIPSPSSIYSTVQQFTTINNKWKQISLQSLDMTSEDGNTKPTPPFHSAAAIQRSIHRKASILYPHTMIPSLATNNIRLPININNKSNERLTDAHLPKTVINPLSKVLNQFLTDTSSDNHHLGTYNQSKYSQDQQPSCTKHSQNAYLKIPLMIEATTNENNHYENNIGTNDQFDTQQQLSKIFRYTSTASLELIHNNHQINTVNPFQSLNRRSHIRKQQPRTNPNYINIQIKGTDGSLRSTYIRINDIPKCQSLSPSSSSSNSSSIHNSILRNSQSYFNELSYGYFPSDETISTERTNHEQGKRIASHQKPPYSSSSSISSSSSLLIDDNETQTNDDKHKSIHKITRMMQNFPTCTDGFNLRSTTESTNFSLDPIQLANNNANAESHKNNNGIIERDIHSNTSIVPSPILPLQHENDYSPLSIVSQSINRSHDTGSIHSSSSLTQSESVYLNGLCSNRKSIQTSVEKQRLPSISSTRSTSTMSEFEFSPMFNDILTLNTHKRGLFSKRLTQDSLLSWSSESIKKPLLRTADKILRKEAPNLFKLIQTYMGDRKSKRIGSLSICLELTTKGWSLPTIRDELYLQLIKQTTCNPNSESLQRGWELITICLSFFPPSSKFQTLLQHFLSINDNEDMDTLDVPISVYAKVCQKRLEKILQIGPKKGLKKPTFEEIELSKHSIHFPSMFGTTLEEVMAMQRTRYPDRRLPWIQTVLSEEIFRLNGTRTEGIFRVPSDVDSVNALKVKCDRWQFPSIDDAHLPASLLKLWYRELADPLIPAIFYEQCIMNCDKVDICIRLVHSLPEINRIVLTYLIHFLQIFSMPENVFYTKMDVNNLSMIFAPNILRCNSDDAKIIFENARKEMLFIKVLILNLDTSSIEGVI